MTEERNMRPMWSEQELDQALSTLRSEVPPGERALARARADLMSAAGNPQPARKRHWGRWGAAVGTVAALVIGVLSVQTVPFGNRPAVANAAAEVLTKAADKIGASDPVVKPGQYLYVESHSWHMHSHTSRDDKTISYLQESVTQTWVPADRTQEWLRRSRNTGQRKWVQGSEADLQEFGVDPNPRDTEEVQAKCGDFNLERGLRPCQSHGNWDQPTPGFLATLPTDPQQLYDVMRVSAAEKDDDPDAEMMDFVASAIHSGIVPANIRANLYRALTLLPSLKVNDQSANLDGQVGIGLGIDQGDWTVELIIDPETGQFIGERKIAMKSYVGQPAGTVVSSTSVSTGVVDNMGDKPGA